MLQIAVLNFKGGCAKSTTAMNLAVGLAQRQKKRILLCDIDPSANASLLMLNGEAPTTPTLADVLLGDVQAAQAIRPTRVGGLDLLPADGRLAHITTAMLRQEEEKPGPERRLRIALRTVEEKYAVCVVDSPPALSILTINALQTCSRVLVPIDPGILAVAGLGTLQETIDRCRHFLEVPDLAIIGMLVTKATGSKTAKALEAQLREVYGKLVYRAAIPFAACVEESHAAYRSVMEAFPKSAVAKAYDELVSEVLKHVDSKRTVGNRTRRSQARAGRAKRRAG
jgi:chromosome partitioning protein